MSERGWEYRPQTGCSCPFYFQATLGRQYKQQLNFSYLKKQQQSLKQSAVKKQIKTMISSDQCMMFVHIPERDLSKERQEKLEYRLVNLRQKAGDQLSSNDSVFLTG